MTTLKSPPPTTNGRISQVLPTVKCSNCNASVALTDLGEHVCAPAPPPAKTPPPKSPSSLLPARLQGLVSRSRNSLRNTRTASQLIPPSPKPAKAPQTPSRAGTPTIKTPQRQQSPAPAPLVPPPTNAAQLSPGWGQPRTPSPLSSGGGSLNVGSGRGAAAERLRATSTSLREVPRPFAQRERTMSAGRSDLPPPRPPPQQQPPAPPPLRQRTPSNASSLRPELDRRASPDRTRPTPPPDRRPSFDSRPTPDSRPSFDSRPTPDRRPSFGSQPTPPPDRRPSFDSRPAPPDRRPSFDSRPPPDSGVRPLRQSSQLMPQATRSSPPLPSPGSMPPPGSLPFPSTPDFPPPGPPRSPVQVEPDTKIGGEAGMAGVGRRGFAAAARAAMFAHTVSGAHVGAGWAGGGVGEVVGGMAERRDNAPRYLDINTSISAFSSPVGFLASSDVNAWGRLCNVTRP
ncbi:hypothetical protein HWV62_8361 [Athelia sp. TMB]|nr:hypothetical protein HWV62_8361 [Athelia sp. TMB]